MYACLQSIIRSESADYGAFRSWQDVALAGLVWAVGGKWRQLCWCLARPCVAQSAYTPAHVRISVFGSPVSAPNTYALNACLCPELACTAVLGLCVPSATRTRATRMHAYVRSWHARHVDMERTGRGRRDHLWGQFLLPPAEGVHAAGVACRLSIISPETGRAGRFGHFCRRAAPSRPAKARAREDGCRA